MPASQWVFDEKETMLTLNGRLCNVSQSMLLTPPHDVCLKVLCTLFRLRIFFIKIRKVAGGLEKLYRAIWMKIGLQKAKSML